jgi:NAD(P)-dependent dehydrogenase (short-subunit alcohol dehydrogenase family)
VAEFEGKVVVVTGVTSGSGRATAVAFARAGALLLLGGRRKQEGRGTLELVRRVALTGCSWTGK